MSVIDILLTPDFIRAFIIYGLAIIIILPLMDKFYATLGDPLLLWKWEQIAVPLADVLLILLFIFLAYPVIFGLHDTPSILQLLSAGDLRVNRLINSLFLVTLFFPLLPVVGRWIELILPLQGIAASMLLFTWLAVESGIENVNYWPGLSNIILIILIAVITHWGSIYIATFLGEKINERFNVLKSEVLVAHCLIVLMQSPAILIYSSGLGKQLA